MTAISPADSDWTILADYLAGVDLITLCENHSISPCDLEHFLNSPRVAPALAALERLHARRTTLAAAQAVLPAINALSITASSIPPPIEPSSDPAVARLHARQHETVRKAASTLLRLAATDRPDSAAPEPVPAHSLPHTDVHADPLLDASLLDALKLVASMPPASMPSPTSLHESPPPEPLPRAA